MPIPLAQTASASAKRFRVLGVDPAVAGATGYGVVEFERGAARMLHFGALRLPAKAPFDRRLREIHDLVAQLVEDYAPDAVAVESVFMALNARTALRLAEVRGVVLLAAAQASVPAHSYSPREVKASVAGFGAATKHQMQRMVRALLGLREAPEPVDAADALAVALCHAQAHEAAMRLGAAAAGKNGAGANLAGGPTHSRSRAARISLGR